VLGENTRSGFNWGARIFLGDDLKVVDSAKWLRWQRKGTIVKRRDGVSKRAENGGAGRKKRGSEDGKEFFEGF